MADKKIKIYCDEVCTKSYSCCATCPDKCYPGKPIHPIGCEKKTILEALLCNKASMTKEEAMQKEKANLQRDVIPGDFLDAYRVSRFLKGKE